MTLSSILIIRNIKHLLSIIICIMAFLQANAQKVTVKHTEESELVSVLCHIGDIDGYVWDDEDIAIPKYFADVDSAFASYKNHPAVKFAKNKLLAGGFAWSTPMDFAMKFKLVNGKVVYIDDIEIDDYYDHITPKNEKKLLKLIQKFYDKSDFHQFYLKHQTLYSECEKAMQKVTDELDLAWYDRFFGKKENNTFCIIPGLLNGPGNYAVHCQTKDGKQSVNAVMGCSGIDDQGKIYYGISYTLPVLIHEFNHSYCNPLNEEYWDEMKEAVTAYFEPNAKFYRSIAYGNPLYVLNETFVEASMIRYLMSHPLDLSGTKYTMPKLIDRYIEIDESNKKFTMIRDIIEALGTREQSPTLYPTMHDFMPEYVKVVKRSAKKQ